MRYTQLTTESKMTKELICIIETVKEKITDNSDVVWTGYNTAKELRKELEKYIDQLKIGDTSCFYNYINIFCRLVYFRNI